MHLFYLVSVLVYSKTKDESLIKKMEEKVMKKSLINLIALFIIMQFSQNVLAGTHGSIGIGLNYNFGYDLDDLNSNFESNYIGTLTDKCGLLNIFVHVFNDENKFIYGVDINTATQFMKKTSKGDSLTSSFYKNSVTLDFGYHLINKTKYSIFPLLGVGYSTNEISIYRNDLEEEWNNFSNSEIENYIICRNDLIMKLSLRAELFLINIQKSKLKLPIGIEAGYILPIYNFDDKFSTGQSVKNFPDYQSDGLFLNFTLGYTDY